VMTLAIFIQDIVVRVPHSASLPIGHAHVTWRTLRPLNGRSYTVDTTEAMSAITPARISTFNRPVIKALLPANPGQDEAQ
jgi:hypothetical protein